MKTLDKLWYASYLKSSIHALSIHAIKGILPNFYSRIKDYVTTI
jgi:hypothetical protein